jgi:membrane-associated phospholipid phosphatase
VHSPVDNIERLASPALTQTRTDPSLELESNAATAVLPRRSPWWLEAITIAWLAWLYDAVTNLPPLRLNAALAHGRSILSTERSLGISPERALDRWLAHHDGLATVLSYYYDNAHFIVTLGILGYLWWRRSDLYRPLRTSLVAINVFGFVVFWLYPVAPPRMLGGFTDIVAASHTLGSWHTGALASDANQLAAMPSLHIGWAIWCTVALWRISSRWTVRAAAVLYPFLTGFAVLATGNHYLFDILGGLLLAAATLVLISLLYGRRAGTRTAPLAGGAS